MEQQYFTLGQAADILGVKAYRVQYLCATRRLVPPPLMLQGRRLFTMDDLVKISEILKLDTAMILKRRGEA